MYIRTRFLWIIVNRALLSVSIVRTNVTSTRIPPVSPMLWGNPHPRGRTDEMIGQGRA